MQALDTCRGETNTKGNNQKTEEQTWICTVQSLLFQSHDGRHAISTLQHIHLRLTHFQCSQYHELQSMLQIPSRLPREYESQSPDHHTRDTVVVTLFSDTATCCTFINVFVTESVIPWYAHPDSQKRKFIVLPVIQRKTKTLCLLLWTHPPEVDDRTYHVGRNGSSDVMLQSLGPTYRLCSGSHAPPTVDDSHI